MSGPTHEVTNQPPSLVGHDVLATDAALVEAVHRYGGAGAVESLTPLGHLAGTEGAQTLGCRSQREPADAA
jgi:putative acyl-CoA dehydrogenase